MKKLLLVSLLLISTMLALVLTGGLVSGGLEGPTTTFEQFSVEVAVNVDSDPGGHAEFIEMPENIKLIVMVETSPDGSIDYITLSGPTPWVRAEAGSVDTPMFPLPAPDVFSLVAAGRGTVADVEGVAVEFTGTFDPESSSGQVLSGFYSMGIQDTGANKLPGGLAIVYRIKPKPGGSVAETLTPTVGPETPTPEPTPTPTIIVLIDPTSTLEPGPTTEVPLSGDGDVNCDGVANAIDASLMLQLLADLLGQLSCDVAANVNGDGVVNAIDVALVLQFEAGFLPGLPIGPAPAPDTPTPTPTPTLIGVQSATPQATATSTPTPTATSSADTGKASIAIEGGPGRPIKAFQGSGCTGILVASLTVSGSLSLSFSPGSFSFMAEDIKGWELAEGVEACQDVELTAGQKIAITFTYQQVAGETA